MAAATVMSASVQRTDSPFPGSDRHSMLSSTASFHTARTATPLDSPHSRALSISSSSSSVHTLGPERSNRNSDVNTVHAAGTHAQEVHIMKVTDDTIQLDPPPTRHSLSHKLPNHLEPGESNREPNGTHIGPPPPSPPASVEREHEDNDCLRVPPSPPLKSFHSTPRPRPITFEEPSRSRDSSGSAGSFETSNRDKKLPSTPIARKMPVKSPSLDERSYTSKSADGFLQPPTPHSIHRERPTRRNTTGSSPRNSHSGTSRHRKCGSQAEDGDYREDDELASDIQLHAEQIRRERLRQRAKAQEAEAALTQPIKEVPLVGKLIGEGHVNYVLMYNMLTGIRIGVSRCQAKIKRPLTDEDFTARHKFSFDIVGNELTPSAKYDFKFKDYAPWVFRELREAHFHLDPADYLLSLTEKYILSELGSSGKSGSFFYFSRDYRFIIKTIHPSEHKVLLSILKSYYAHVKSNPHTLLSRFYGLHRVKLPRGRKIHFVIMNNLFPPHRDIHETYDLKGSTVGRLYPEEKAAKNPRAVMKDINWINRDKQLELGPEKRALLCEQLRRDSEWLKSVRVMDYSLLVGIHNMQRGNKDNVRRNTLKVFSPEVSQIRRKTTHQKGARSPEAVAMRRAIGARRATASKDFTLSETDVMTGDRQHFLFYQDEGGLQATGEENENLDTIYYLGVIDILTPYTIFKRAERIWKGIGADVHKISPVPPSEYGDRFFRFMKAIVTGGAGGKSFLPD